MKKFVTLTLMLLTTATMATLSSCDIVEAVLPYVDVEGIIGELEDTTDDIQNGIYDNGYAENNKNDNGNTENESIENEDTENKGADDGGEPEEARTTITQDEWLAFMDGTNYTYDLKFINVKEDGTEECSFQRIDNITDTAAFLGSRDTHYTKIDGDAYEIHSYDTKCVASKTDDYEFGKKIWDYFAFDGDANKRKTAFDSFVYDEENKSYKGTLPYKFMELTDMSCEISFENGKATKFIGVCEYCDENGKCVGKIVVEFSSIGTTTVKLPEYTAICSISYSEWSNMVSVTNYSKKTITYDKENGELTGNISYENNYEFNNTDAHLNDIKYTVDGEIEILVDYYATIIDGQNYSIRYNDNGYVAKPVVALTPNCLISSTNASRWYGALKDIGDNTYAIDWENAEEKVDCVIKVNDGKIVSMTLTRENYYDKTVSEFFDFGTTVVTLPEYTFEE